MSLRVRNSVLMALLMLGAANAFAQGQRPGKLELRRGWQLQSGCKLKQEGEQLSTARYRPSGWIAATVPTTVLAAQVAAGIYKDPYFGMNLRNIPGTTYPISRMFANLPMPADSPYACPWWYRTEFTLPAAYRGKQVWLHFGGVNYRANVWLNGKQIAKADEMAGMWREWEFNITNEAVSGRNVLAVQVFAQKENELGITFVDWNPMPPDKDMGIFRPVWIEATGPVRLRHAFVSTELDSEFRVAHLRPSVELTNTSDQAVSGLLSVAVDAYAVRPKPVSLEPHETLTVEVEDAGTEGAPLTRTNPELWWPYGMGAQPLLTARFDFHVGGSLSDTHQVRFAIRSVTSELTPDGARLFKVNGRPFLVRGAGYTPDMLLRHDPARLHAEFDYVRDMGLNTIRLEGKFEPDEFFDLADRMGIMVMAGWCCCDFWEKWKDWKPGDVDIAAASLADQIRRLRSHPSLLVWLNGSDNPPPPEIEKRYLAVLEQYGWPNPALSSATAKPSEVTGKSGVKMAGPYDFVPPNYWLTDPGKWGGAWGFATEIGPGPAIPPAENIRKMLPPEHLWPVDDWWNYHAGGGTFKNIDLYTAALNARYGPSRSLEQFTVKSQSTAYDGQRAMFEAYIRNRYASTGVIQWMLNNAWPSIIWHLYDWWLTPAGGYFGTKKANEPVHIMYGYNDRGVIVSNLTQEPLAGLRVRARVLNLDMSERFAREALADAGVDSVAHVFDIPAFDDPGAYFLDLRLLDAGGKELSRNFYWLSGKPDVLDWEKSKYFYTPQTQFADLGQLDVLPKVALELRSRVLRGRETTGVQVTVKNPTRALAFMVRLRVANGPRGDDILPVRWEDNFFPLLPYESRTVTAVFDSSALAGKTPVVKVEGWNVESATEVRPRK